VPRQHAADLTQVKALGPDCQRHSGCPHGGHGRHGAGCCWGFAATVREAGVQPRRAGALARRIAVPGVTLRLPLIVALTATRGMPSFAASSACVRPSGRRVQVIRYGRPKADPLPDSWGVIKVGTGRGKPVRPTCRWASSHLGRADPRRSTR